MSLPRSLAKVRPSTQKLRVVRPDDPMYAPTEPISVDYVRQITGERAKRSTPPPLPPAALRVRTGSKPISPSGSVAPLTTTVVTRRPAGGSLIVSLWAAWLGAAVLFLGTAAIVLRIETRDHAPQVSAAAPAPRDVTLTVVPAVEVPRVVIPRDEGTIAEHAVAPAPVADVAKPAAARVTPKSKSRTTSTIAATAVAPPPSRPASPSMSPARGSEIVRSIDFGNEPPSSSKPASAPPAETAQAVIKSADAELQAVVRAMH